MSDRGQPIYIDVQAFMSAGRKLSPAAIGIAMGLLGVYMDDQRGFLWDAERLAPLLNMADATPAKLDAHREEVAQLFTVLADGRWVPSPKFFSMTDGNADRPS